MGGLVGITIKKTKKREKAFKKFMKEMWENMPQKEKEYLEQWDDSIFDTDIEISEEDDSYSIFDERGPIYWAIVYTHNQKKVIFVRANVTWSEASFLIEEITKKHFDYYLQQDDSLHSAVVLESTIPKHIKTDVYQYIEKEKQMINTWCP